MEILHLSFLSYHGTEGTVLGAFGANIAELGQREKDAGNSVVHQRQLLRGVAQSQENVLKNLRGN